MSDPSGQLPTQPVWGGEERRRSHVELGRALDDVRQLSATISGLAGVVETHTIPKTLLAEVETRLRRLVVAIGIMLGALLLVLIIYGQVQVGRITGGHEDIIEQDKKGVEQLSCTLLTPPEERGPQVVATCRQATE